MKHRRGFIVLTTQRTGSSWVVDVLNRCDGIKTYGELFLRQRRERPETVSNDYPRFIEYQGRRRGPLRPASVFRYLDGLYRQPPLVGFKLMYSQARDLPEVPTYLAFRGIPVIHLIRQNHLEVVISNRLAEVSGRSHLRVGESQAGPATVELDASLLLGRLRRLERNQRAARRALGLCRLRQMEISYEELLADDRLFLRICAFLQAPTPAEPPGSGLVKRRKGRPLDCVSNIDEVRAVLAGSEFEGLLAG